MKILLATPLYPPDIEQPAPQVKELATRLSSSHEVHVLTYGRLPEQIPGVQITAVSKARALPLRLVSFMLALHKLTRTCDVMYIQNGASVELPASIVSMLTRKPLILHFGDTRAHDWADRSFVYKIIENFASRIARKTVSDLPPVRPEIVPFAPYPAKALEAYESGWRTHIQALEQLFATYA